MNGSGMAVANSVIGGFGNGPDKSKEFQMELLMERLRTKTSQYKTLTETSKAVRMTMLDKRWALDTADRAILQKCLDSLQHSIKVCSFQSLVERLECLSRQLGFKFLVGPSGVDLFISSDMFYLEILLEASGTVKDVKIHHEGKKEQQSCEELVSCISRGDFTDFTAQLEGLTAMYQLNADKKAKAMAFSALAALEADLGTLAQIQATLKDPWAQVHKSPIGFVQKRRGGHAMRLTYFVSPYEVARCPGGSLTVESLSGTNGAGHSVRVLLESAAAHKLQFAPLIAPLAGSRTPNNGPMYSPLSASNCVTLPARFVLKLSQPMPVCGALLKMMSAAGESTEGGMPATLFVLPTQEMKPLLSLVAKHSSSVDINPNKGLFVTLPDQNQCYFLTESRGLDGCMVESVPFTHPRQVSTLITRLRQQAIFNALIASCVRPNSKQDLESSLMVEVSALSWQHISVCLEQPGEGGMATLELELPEGCSPRVSIHGGFGGGVAGSASRPDEKLGRVLARTLSIPLLVRALVMGWERERERERETRSGFSGGAGGTDPGGAPPSPSAHYNAHAHHPQGTFLNDPQTNLPLFGNQDTNLSSMMGNSNGGGVGMQASNTPQLMPHQLVSASHQVTFTPMEEKKSSKKRKHDNSDSDGWNKKSKPQAVCEVLLESSSNSSASVEESDQEEEPVHSNSSNDEEEEERGASPTSFMGFTSDLDPAELTRDGSSNDNRTSCSEFENSGDGEINDSQDMDDIIRSASNPSKSESKRHKHKNREHGSGSSSKLSGPSSLLMELTEGSSPAVSITPLSPSTAGSIIPNSTPGFSSVLGMRLERRPGIEIIPISSEPRAALIGGSVTITPITPSQAKSMDERHRSDRKSGSSGKSSRSDKDKKKKRRHEDSMGPPEKLPPKQDPLTKPVSVSIKPADGSRSPLSGGSQSPLPAGKFSPSPTHGRSVSVSKSSGSGSPGSVKSSGKPSSSSSHHGSPRHSPVRSSPKRAPPGYSSPKNHGTSSPKHISGSGSSGKPSMSALKSAAGGSPSGKSSSSYDLTKPSKGSSGKESSSSSRDKDRKSSGGLSYSSSGGGSPKMKSSTVKLKQLDLSTTMNELHSSSAVNDSMISPGPDLNKSATPNQLRNRKGSLSAVIDKLKSAQHCSEPEGTVAKSSSSSSSSGKDRSSNPSSKLNDSKTTSNSGSSKLNDSKTQEYMVKPSSDGMKITFNKTRTKESSSSSGGSKSSGFSGSSSSSSSTPKQSSSSSTSSQSTTGTGSPKTHTGLKPGVISGPASKKPQALQSSKTGSLSNSNPSSVSSGSPGSSNKISSNSLSVTGGTSKVPFTKSSSGSSLSSSSAPKSSSKVSTGSPKMSSSANDLSKLGRDREREREREKSRSSKSTSSSGSSSDKSIFSSSKSSERRSSPAPSRDDGDGERAFKMLSQHSKDPGFIVEGLIKSLDTSKYQIPKLSARVPSDDPTKTKNSSNDKTSTPVTPQTDPSNMSNRNAVNDTSTKMLDYMGRSQDLPGSKYSFPHLANSKMPDQMQKSLSTPASSTVKPTINITSSGPKLQTDPLPLVSASKTVDTSDGLQPSNYSFSSLAKAQSESVKDSKTDAKVIDGSRTNTGQQIHSGGSTREDLSSNKIDYSKPYPAISVCSADTINQSIVKKIDSHSNKGFTMPQIKPPTEESARKMLAMSTDPGMKPPPAIGKLPSTSEAAEMLLDFSSSSGSKPGSEIKNKLAAERVNSNMRRHTPPLVLPSQAPSLSVHIVKSPAPSPLIVPSPHSNSPCITDDELMDEAVVGPGK